MTTSSNQFNPATYVGAQGKYDNWMNYAGIKPTDTLQPVVPHKNTLNAIQSGNQTPTDASSYMNQAIVPIQNKLTNYSNAGSQLLQGNFVGALNSVHAGQNGSSPIPSMPANQTPSQINNNPNPYDYQSNIDEE